MTSIQHFLPGFQHLFRDQIRDQFQAFLRSKNNSQQSLLDFLSSLFDGCLDLNLLTLPIPGRRSRIFNPLNTFVAFLYQILVQGSCRHAVQFLSHHLLSHRLALPCQTNTSNYCRARLLLNDHLLEQLAQGTIKRLCCSLTNNVYLIDGTSLSMPDTHKNQSLWPQSSVQKEGLGFPLLKLVVLYDLASNALVDYRTGNKNNSEVTLARMLYCHLKQGDILIVDGAFCSYRDIALLSQQGVTIIVKNSHMKHDLTSLKHVGFKDHVKTLIKPRTLVQQEKQEGCNEASDFLDIRIIQTDQFCVKGFRSNSHLIITNQINPERLSRRAMALFYRSRWRVETCFSSLKTQLEMDVLSCKSPEMIFKELRMYQIVYNLIYIRINKECDNPFDVSFTAVMCRLRECFVLTMKMGARAKRILGKMFLLVAQDKLYRRLGRYEPRVVKRRAKPIHLMTKPRCQYAWGEVIDPAY